MKQAGRRSFLRASTMQPRSSTSWLLAVLACGVFSSALAGGGGGYAYNGFIEIPQGDPVPEREWVCGPRNNCYCAAWNFSHGSSAEATCFKAFQWIVFGVCIASLVFYAYQTWRATCGWEEVYVCIIELVHVCFGLWHETNSPATLYLSTGNTALWLRYSEWLLTCPVILIHLSNLTGMKNDYNKRTMALLVSDVGCIVWGTTSALATNYVKIIFYFLGLLYGMYTFYAAAKIYVEAYHTVPKGICRQLVRFQAYDFFFTWSMFPILFMLGPEGFNEISAYSSGIAHEVCDLLSKNLWGLLGHTIRYKIHEHILLNGNITKKTKVNVGGDMVEVEEYVDADDPDSAEAVDKGTAELANRASFVVMRDHMKAKGLDVRASLGGPEEAEHDVHNGHAKGILGGGALEAGRVILCVPDMSLVDFFREQFAQLPAPVEVVPALGPEVGLQLVQQALSLGGPAYVDYVLVHPELLRDKSPSGFAARVKTANVRVCAFGWAPSGPMRELIEAAGPLVDGYVEGPSFSAGFNVQQLLQLTQRMQMLKKQRMMGGMGMGGGMNGGMGGMGGGMNNGMGMGGMNGGMGSGVGMNGMGGGIGGSMGGSNGMASMGGMGGSQMGMNGMGMHSPTPMMGSMSGGGMGSPMGAANPLYGTAPSPLGSGIAPAPAAAPAAAPAPNETEMLTQLMGEINRLKHELGEH